MAAIRRSGGLVAWFWQGKVPDPRDPAFAEALAKRRFRTIEDAASEEVAVGWVSPGDPTGDSFDTEDLDADVGTWLRMRVDKKKLPLRWLGIHRDVAEKARGRRLSARERKELRDDLMEKLLPRVLPTVNFVDALLYHERRTVLLFATGTSVREAFGKLFFESFGLPLERADPYQLALAAVPGEATGKALERCEAVRWPSAEAPPRRPAPVRAATGGGDEDDDGEAEA